MTATGGAFTLDMASGALTHYDSKAALVSTVTPRPSLAPTAQFYYASRWNWTDVVALALVVAIEIRIAWRGLQKLRVTVPPPAAATLP